jgi:transcriptional regulator with XRE-family HTH domain
MAESNNNNFSRNGNLTTSSELKIFFLTRKIEQAIKEKGLNRQSFAALMEVQPSMITRWLSGKHNFTIETLFEIEERLNLKLLAVELPDSKTITFHLKVHSNHVNFHGAGLFPGFTSLNFNENQSTGSEEMTDDINEYLTYLKINLTKHGK